MSVSELVSVSEVSANFVSESESEVENSHQTESEVMTMSESMFESVFEVQENHMSVPESALVMNPCSNSCPCPFISGLGLKVSRKLFGLFR